MKPKQAKRSKQSYSADRPIRSKKDDILGRAKFAARLADDIHSWDGNDSLVIALYGAWGAGKTSVKNMLLLTVLLGEMHSWGQQHQVRYYILLSVVERFSDVAKLTKFVGQVKEPGLSKKEVRAIQEFKNALKRRAEGKSDEAWKDDHGGYEEVLE